MDLGKLFNLDGDDNNQSLNGGSMSAVESLLKEVSEKFEQDNNSSSSFTMDDAMAAFNAKYGDMQNFMENHYGKMSEEYEEATIDAITKYMQSKGKPDYGSLVASGMIEASKTMVQKMIMANTDSLSQSQETFMKSATLAQKIDGLLPNRSPHDDMIACLAVMAVAYVRLGELTAHAEAERLAQGKEK